MSIFENDVLQRRQQRACGALGDNPPIVLFGAGRPVQIPGGQDQTYPFVPYPEYYWLTGSRRWGGVLAFDPQEGWTHFVRPVSQNERLWEGGGEAVEGEDVADLPGWLERRGGRAVAVIGGAVENAESDPLLASRLQSSLDGVRRRKDVAEIELMERAAIATAAGHARARDAIQPGVSERRIRIELEAAMYRNGADDVAFDTIVGAGTHAAVLHFEPGARTVAPDDLVLIDAGASIAGYVADVTRTYPAGDRFTPRQQAIYDLVLAAQLKAISTCRKSVEWHQVHRAAAGVIALGLRDMGILRGTQDDLLDSGAISLFLPHGVGHMVGLGVRDVGGRAAGREVSVYCGIRMRLDLPLEEDFVMTVEPGVYFVPALLDDPDRRERFGGVVDWDTLESWRTVGGVRIEDNVLITAADPRILTSGIPK